MFLVDGAARGAKELYAYRGFLKITAVCELYIMYLFFVWLRRKEVTVVASARSLRSSNTHLLTDITGPEDCRPVLRRGEMG